MIFEQKYNKIRIFIFNTKTQGFYVQKKKIYFIPYTDL